MSASPIDLPSVRRLGPASPRHPVIVAVPHAGRDYPAALLGAARASPDQLAGLEDRHADRLAEQAADAGAAVFVARRPRAWIDLNRGEREIDPAMLAPPPPAHALESNVRVRGGLGLVPRRGAGGVELWRRAFSPAEITARIANDHRPWHAMLGEALAAARARFGVAVLLDLHSMPPLLAGRGLPAARLVIGDRHGASAARRLRDTLEHVGRASGLRHAVNSPYAGGHTLDRHGRPAHGVHALQLEIDRTLYLAGDLRTIGPGLAAMQGLVASAVAALAEAAIDNAVPEAAE